MKIILASGGFDPIHSGHIAYFKASRSLGDKLIVALNSDEWLVKKKDKYFMPFSERKTILENLSCVDQVIDFKDDEIGSCIDALEKIKKLFPEDEILFCNGGDRNKKNIPECNKWGFFGGQKEKDENKLNCIKREKQKTKRRFFDKLVILN